MLCCQESSLGMRHKQAILRKCRKELKKWGQVQFYLIHRLKHLMCSPFPPSLMSLPFLTAFCNVVVLKLMTAFYKGRCSNFFRDLKKWLSAQGHLDVLIDRITTDPKCELGLFGQKQGSFIQQCYLLFWDTHSTESSSDHWPIYKYGKGQVVINSITCLSPIPWSHDTSAENPGTHGIVG